jgi:L-fucose isomerase
MKAKPRVGFMALTWPGLYEASTETGEAWVQVEDTMQAIKGLEETRELDLVVHRERVVSEIDEALKVVDRFLSEDCDCMVLFVQTWNWASRIMQAAQAFGRPIVLWALPIPRQWSIGGLAVTHGSFDEVGIEHTVVYGMPDDPGVREEIIRYARAASVKNVLSKSHFGSIGGQGMGIHTGPIDANQWFKEFGILVSFSDLHSVVSEGEKCSTEEIKAYHEQLRSEYGEVPALDQIMERSIRLYLGMEKIIEREGYDFTGVNDMNGLSDTYCSMCLAQSRLSSRGFVSACLNDCNGALTLYILRRLSDGPLFTADVNLVDKANKIVRLIDDGAGSIHLAADAKDVKLSYQPKLECKASGVCTGLVAKSGRITLARLARLEGSYVMHIASGEAFEGERAWVHECGYPMWPHAFLHLDGDLNEFVRNLRSEYIHMAYGDLTDDLLEVCRLLNIRPIVT